MGDVVISAHFTEISPNDPNANLVIDTWNSDFLTFESLVTSTVVKVWEWVESGQYTFNGKLKTTASQPFITKDLQDERYYYTRANAIVIGDHFFDEELQDWVPVFDIQYDPSINFDVKIIETSPYDMFFAENTLVHNK